MGLFRRENSDAARRERVEQVERAMVDGFRALADVLRRAADLLEQRRLSRQGYAEQDRYLERVRRKDTP
jgi:hypothetical protein